MTIDTKLIRAFLEKAPARPWSVEGDDAPDEAYLIVLMANAIEELMDVYEESDRR